MLRDNGGIVTDAWQLRAATPEAEEEPAAAAVRDKAAAVTPTTPGYLHSAMEPPQGACHCFFYAAVYTSEFTHNPTNSGGGRRSLCMAKARLAYPKS